MQNELIKVLLIEDDETESVTTRKLFSEMGEDYVLERVSGYEECLSVIDCQEHDIILVGSRPGKQSNTDLTRAAKKRGSHIPPVVIDDSDNPEIILQAINDKYCCLGTSCLL